MNDSILFIENTQWIRMIGMCTWTKNKISDLKKKRFQKQNIQSNDAYLNIHIDL